MNPDSTPKFRRMRSLQFQTAIRKSKSKTIKCDARFQRFINVFLFLLLFVDHRFISLPQFTGTLIDTNTITIRSEKSTIFEWFGK